MNARTLYLLGHGYLCVITRPAKALFFGVKESVPGILFVRSSSFLLQQRALFSVHFLADA